MVSFLRFLKYNGLVRDNIIFFSATMLLNLIGFFYHAYMGRALGPAQYGILGAMLSILYLLNVVLNVIQTSVTRFVSKYKAEKDFGSINYIFRHGLKYFVFFGLGAFVVYAITGLFFADFLHIPYKLYIYLGFVVPFVFSLPLNRGVLQGMQRFIGLGINNVVEGVFKLAVGISLVLLGWGVGGAVLGITFSYVGAFIFSFFSLRSFFGGTTKKVEKKSITSYSFPVLFTLLLLTALYSFDVFLVKHYFMEQDAGFYAAATLLGKIVFFACLSLIMVMFPKVSEAYDKKNYTRVNKILLTSLSFICLISLGIIGFYYLFPTFVIMVLFGEQFLSIFSIIPLFALVYGLFSLIYAYSMFNLSIHRYSFIYFIFIINIIEVLLIVFYHPSLFAVLGIVSLVLSILLLFLIIYTHSFRLEKKSFS